MPISFFLLYDIQLKFIYKLTIFSISTLYAFYIIILDLLDLT